MATELTLGQISNTLAYSAILVYAITMLAYAGEAALRARSGPVPEHVVIPRPAMAVTAGTSSEQASFKGSAPGLGDADASVPGGSGSTPGSIHRRLGRVAVVLTVLGFLLHLAAVVTRGLAAGRAPWGNMYEFALAGALAAAGAYLVLLRRQPVRDLGVWIVAVVTLTLGLAVTVLYTPAGDLVPALDSYWLVVHVAAAIVSGGLFTVGAGVSVLLLVRIRSDQRASVPAPHTSSERRGYAAHLPPAATLDRVAHAAHVFAFPIWTFAVIAGAIWAEDSWGRYWGWDPKETWAFITWVCYAAYLHAQATAGWRGRRATWFAMAGYIAFVFNFFGVNMWITGLHSYAGV